MYTCTYVHTYVHNLRGLEIVDQSSKCPTYIILGQPFVLAKVKCYFYHCYYTSLLQYEDVTMALEELNFFKASTEEDVKALPPLDPHYTCSFAPCSHFEDQLLSFSPGVYLEEVTLAIPSLVTPQVGSRRTRVTFSSSLLAWYTVLYIKHCLNTYVPLHTRPSCRRHLPFFQTTTFMSSLHIEHKSVEYCRSAHNTGTVLAALYVHMYVRTCRVSLV